GSRCERSSHHGVEKRTPAHARRRLKRKKGGFWRSQFCTELARPIRFELRILLRCRYSTGGDFARSSAHCHTTNSDLPPMVHCAKPPKSLCRRSNLRFF